MLRSNDLLANKGYARHEISLSAMVTYSSHRLIIGKEEVDTLFCLNGDIFDFLQECLLSSSLRFMKLLSKSLNLIGCRVVKKG